MLNKWGRIDMPPAAGGTGTEAQDDEQRTDLTTRDQLTSAGPGQRRGRIDMQQAAEGTGTKRRRVRQQIADQLLRESKTLRRKRLWWLKDNGGTRGRIDMLQAAGDTGHEAEDAEMRPELTTRDQQARATT